MTPPFLSSGDISPLRCQNSKRKIDKDFFMLYDGISYLKLIDLSGGK
jgi:hypothetical protein